MPALEVGAEVQVRAYAVLIGDPFQVGADLGLPGEDVRPLAVQSEAERVQMTGDIARAAGVRVVPPGAPDAVGALEEDEIALAVA